MSAAGTEFADVGEVGEEGEGVVAVAFEGAALAES